MASGHLERFIKRVHTDSAFKRLFLSDPDRAMQDSGLDKSAKRAIFTLGPAAVAGTGDVAQAVRVIDPTQIWYG